jgi:hypothetical protein
VLDVVEAVRPLAEVHVLRLLRSHPMCWRDFHEDHRGLVRVPPPLTHRLAEAMPGFAASLSPVVEHVARLLATSSPYDVSLPSVLTKERHKAAARRRVAPRTRDEAPRTVGPASTGLPPRKKRRQKPAPELEPILPLPVCKGCGAILEPEIDRKRRRGAYCPDCLA